MVRRNTHLNRSSTSYERLRWPYRGAHGRPGLSRDRRHGANVLSLARCTTPSHFSQRPRTNGVFSMGMSVLPSLKEEIPDTTNSLAVSGGGISVVWLISHFAVPARPPWKGSSIGSISDSLPRRTKPSRRPLFEAERVQVCVLQDEA